MSDYLDIIDKAAQKINKAKTNFVDKTISKANFDKTYIGRVVDRELYSDGNKIRRWLVSANGRTYYVGVNESDITNIGQQVRLYIPSNKYENKYAEVINPSRRPDKIVFTNNNDTEEDIEIINGEHVPVTWSTSSVTETWELSDKTILERDYTITVKNRGIDNEECTAITCPDGFVIWLEGFYLNEFGGAEKKMDNGNNTA